MSSSCRFRRVDAKVTVGLRIREGRERLGLSQEAFAEQMGTSFQQVGRVERGEHDLRLSTLLMFAAGIGVDVADLLRGVQNDKEPADH
jgi:transcriptional regulator with XRE-family HTH domain